MTWSPSLIRWEFIITHLCRCQCWSSGSSTNLRKASLCCGLKSSRALLQKDQCAKYSGRFLFPFNNSLNFWSWTVCSLVLDFAGVGFICKSCWQTCCWMLTFHSGSSMRLSSRHLYCLLSSNHKKKLWRRWWWQMIGSSLYLIDLWAKACHDLRDSIFPFDFQDLSPASCISDKIQVSQEEEITLSESSSFWHVHTTISCCVLTYEGNYWKCVDSLWENVSGVLEL